MRYVLLQTSHGPRHLRSRSHHRTRSSASNNVSEPAMKTRWMSDRTIGGIVSDGFWKTALQRGVFRFGLAAVVLLTLLGLIWSGTELFELSWWRTGLILAVVGG